MAVTGLWVSGATPLTARIPTKGEYSKCALGGFGIEFRISSMQQIQPIVDFIATLHCELQNAATMTQAIQDLDLKISQLQARKAKLIARETIAQRRTRTRQCIIVGAWVLENRPLWADEVKTALTRRQDRECFGLTEEPVSVVGQGGKGMVTGEQSFSPTVPVVVDFLL